MDMLVWDTSPSWTRFVIVSETSCRRNLFLNLTLQTERSCIPALCCYDGFSSCFYPLYSLYFGNLASRPPCCQSWCFSFHLLWCTFTMCDHRDATWIPRGDNASWDRLTRREARDPSKWRGTVLFGLELCDGFQQHRNQHIEMCLRVKFKWNTEK